PLDLELFADITDATHQGAFARTRIRVHPASFYVGLAPKTRIATARDPLPIEAIAVSPDGKTRFAARIELHLLALSFTEKPSFAGGRRARRTRWERHEREVGRCALTTLASEGQEASCSLTPPLAGAYALRAVAVDSRGRRAVSAVELYAIERA